MNSTLIHSKEKQEGSRIISIWNLCQSLIYLSIPLVVTINFYGLYTHEFYWLKPDNFILPTVILIHLQYQRELQKRIKGTKGVHFLLQKLEFAMYGVVLIYGFELLETAYTLFQSSSYDRALFPETFWTQALIVVSLQIVFAFLTIYSFYLRRLILGPYNFDYFSTSPGFSSGKQYNKSF